MNCEKVISRKNLTKEEWLVYRRSGIGGSDAGAIAGLTRTVRRTLCIWTSSEKLNR